MAELRRAVNQRKRDGISNCPIGLIFRHVPLLQMLVHLNAVVLHPNHLKKLEFGFT
jgi:hypothetical protein